MPDHQRPKRTGLAHIIAACVHSLDGLRRLMRESAFWQELALILGLLVLFMANGASWAAIGGLVALGLCLLAVEAVNTAIEVIIDHLSPEWAEWARDAKDLGSFAVGAVIVGVLIYAAVVLFA